MNRNRVLSGALLALLGVSAILFLPGCSDSSTSGYEYAKWSFNGFVRNGATGERLEGVRIRYIDSEGEECVEISDSSGSFYIPGLTYGEKTFRFSYSESPEDDSTVYFTEKRVKVSSYKESTTMEGVIGGKSSVVDMYPMNSSLSAGVYVNTPGSGRSVPAEGAEITAYYKDSTFVNTSESGFTAEADSAGEFVINNLPAAESLTLRVSNYVYKGESYSAERVELPELVPGEECRYGNIYLFPSDSVGTGVYTVASNTLTGDGYGKQGIAVDAVLWYILSQRIDSEDINISLSCFGDEEVEEEISGDTVFAYHSMNIPYDTEVSVSISGSDTNGRKFEIELDDERSFKTVKQPYILKSNVLSDDGMGLNGVSVNTVPWYLFSEEFSSAGLTAEVTGLDSSGINTYINGDTVFVGHYENFPKASVITVEIKGVDINGNKVVTKLDSTRAFSTEQAVHVVSSNVTTSDGLGKSGVPADIVPFYVLSEPPDPDYIDAELTGSDISTAVSVNRDTLFINHGDLFPGGTLIGVSITGEDTSGNSIDITFDEEKRFRTEKRISAVESNAWRSSESYRNHFSLYDTIWVRFSSDLKDSIDFIEWYSSDADRDIFCSGSRSNAEASVSGDTLFVVPDQRLSVNYGETMGFNVTVMAENGAVSDTTAVSVNVVEENYNVVWTNTKDELGNMRTDMSVNDSVVVVSNKPLNSIRGVSGYSDRILPADIMLDNIHIRGDTIVYSPGVPFTPGVTYGLDFDITGAEGEKRDNVLGVLWECSRDIRIVSVDNRENGVFREFRSIGDTLRVSFSKSIDTSYDSPVKFRVNMEDVNGNQVRTGVVWSDSSRTARIFNTSPLPVADFNSPLGNTEEAVNSRAVAEVTFDLAAKDGEQAYGLSPVNDSIEIHTEEGLVPVESNILKTNNSGYAIETGEIPVEDFSSAGAVSVVFNRELDVSAITSKGDSLFVGLVEDGGDIISSEISFANDDREVVITPESPLSSGTQYHVWFKSIPGLGISDADAINNHSGRFSGQGGDNHLLEESFGVE